VCNWTTSIYDNNIECEFSNIAKEYMSYYKDHSTSTHYYFTPHEHNCEGRGYFFHGNNVYLE
jgi:hypothetical protein